MKEEMPRPGESTPYTLLPILALPLIFILAAARLAANPASEHLWLKARGRLIVTSSESDGGERPFIAAGMAYCRDVIIPAQDEAVMAFCKEHNLNTVRLTFYTLYFDNDKSRPIEMQEHIRNHIEPAVAAARNHGMYVILACDEHMSDPSVDGVAVRAWDEAAIQKWVAGWTAVAEYYKGEPRVLGYEFLGEPIGVTFEQMRSNYARCRREIRKVDDRHLLILGANHRSRPGTMQKSWELMPSIMDAPYNNVAFAFHAYPGEESPVVIQNHVVQFRDAHGVPVLCTQFGADYQNKSEAECRKFLAGMHASFAKEDVGWMIWALRTLVDHPRNSYNAVDQTGLGPPPTYDSCPYSDLWAPAARMTASAIPQPKR
ncbi:glycoside hydrolase family 5 protein [Termitidicoccus mucosus]|uniref:Glycoside hydrolase family 5 domain-containing protein n=1 Tax=Termitidicoccus mucosus TaxID=1184151 RepID=A0A178IKQ0_9BACT|nr:hypothetical protein AW736_07765 [Opitutaceae bacterium TSB47]